MKIKSITLAFLVIIGILSACSTAQSASLEGDWILVSYGDSANPTSALPNVETNIKFADSRFGGTVGCNSIGADYKVNGNEITFGPVVATRMFCMETSTQEDAVLAILSESGLTYQVNGNQLVISAGDAVVNFSRK